MEGLTEVFRIAGLTAGWWGGHAITVVRTAAGRWSAYLGEWEVAGPCAIDVFGSEEAALAWAVDQAGRLARATLIAQIRAARDRLWDEVEMEPVALLVAHALAG